MLLLYKSLKLLQKKKKNLYNNNSYNIIRIILCEVIIIITVTVNVTSSSRIIVCVRYCTYTYDNDSDDIRNNIIVPIPTIYTYIYRDSDSSGGDDIHLSASPCEESTGKKTTESKRRNAPKHMYTRYIHSLLSAAIIIVMYVYKRA